MVSGRFLAFKGPADGGALREAGWALHPGDYVEVLLHKRAVGVVRLNDPRSYDAAAFVLVDIRFNLVLFKLVDNEKNKSIMNDQ